MAAAPSPQSQEKLQPPPLDIPAGGDREHDPMELAASQPSPRATGNLVFVDMPGEGKAGDAAVDMEGSMAAGVRLRWAAGGRLMPQSGPWRSHPAALLLPAIGTDSPAGFLCRWAICWCAGDRQPAVQASVKRPEDVGESPPVLLPPQPRAAGLVHRPAPRPETACTRGRSCQLRGLI